MKKYSILNTILLIFLLITISLSLIVIADKLILTNDFYDRNGQSLSGIPDMETTVYQSIQKVIYIYSSAYLFIKIAVIALVLYTGLYFFDVKVLYRDLLRIVTWAEFLFLVPAIEKIYFFHQYKDNLSLEQWQKYSFMSLASLMDTIKPAFLYPLQSLNVFEVIYWCLLAAGMESVTGISFKKSLWVISCSYVPALFVWIVMVVFFTIVYFPQSY